MLILYLQNSGSAWYVRHSNGHTDQLHTRLQTLQTHAQQTLCVCSHESYAGQESSGRIICHLSRYSRIPGWITSGELMNLTLFHYSESLRVLSLSLGYLGYWRGHCFYKPKKVIPTIKWWTRNLFTGKNRYHYRCHDGRWRNVSIIMPF